MEFHFVSLIPSNGQVVLLDGLAGVPVSHGAIDSASKSDGAAAGSESFLKAAVKVVQSAILSKMGGNVHLNCVALVRQSGS